MTTPGKAVAAEHWYRHGTSIENIFATASAVRPPAPPSGYHQVNMAWMWGALLAASIAAWLHQLTGLTAGEDILHGHGVRGGKAMIATLRRRLIAVHGRLIHHARHLILRLPPGRGLLPEVLTRLRELPPPPELVHAEPQLPVLAHGSPAPDHRNAPKPRTRRRLPGYQRAQTRKPDTPRSITKAGVSHRAMRNV